MSFEIEVADRQNLVSVDPEWIRRRVVQTLQAEQVAEAEISVALLDDAAIHELNREHLGHDYPTDVISFVYEARRVAAGDELPERAPRGRGLCLDGEILMSTQTAQREASRWAWSAQDELSLYVVHGLLHLCGYDDLSEDELAVMRERERTILKFWDLSPHYEG